MKQWILVIFILSFNVNSKSIASFPKNLSHWVLVKESIIPGKDVILPKETSLFIQNTVKTYNWINNGKGTKLNIFVPKEKLEAYKTHGPYKDGPTAAGIYEDSDIIFITEHIEGEAVYGTYDRQGNDISDTHPTFQINMCQQCHVANEAICINGTCAQPIIDIFKENIK